MFQHLMNSILLIQDFTRLELIAPTAKAIGIFALFSEIFLSLNIKVVLPSLTAISVSS